MNHEFFGRYTHKQLKKYTHNQMSYTYWFVFICDRTKEDVLQVIKLNERYLNLEITKKEKDEWIAGIKGALNAYDLQRIEWNIKIIGDFEMLKLSLSEKKWSHGDIPKVSDFVRILGNILKIRSMGVLMKDTPNVPEQPLTTYPKWNDIERILHDVAFVYGKNMENLNYCGEIYAGEGIGDL